MRYNDIIHGIFLERLNRFIARVLVDGKPEIVHVKNTGRCKELLLNGSHVILEKAVNPQRKTAFSLIAVYKNDLLINIDSQVPNQVVYDGLLSGKLGSLHATYAKREVTYGRSRFDIYFESDNEKSFMEVKGVTLEDQGVSLFPDAPTERGTKHLEELIRARKEGYHAFVVFLIQMKRVKLFRPNYIIDPKFAETLVLARTEGVEILAYDSVVDEQSIQIGQAVKMAL